MQRLTARFLVLFALAGTFVPVALAATAAPPHACCIRKAMHQCHGSGQSDQLMIRGAGCCGHDCSRGVTTSQWAHPQPASDAAIVHQLRAHIPDASCQAVLSDLFSSRSSRAPPFSAVA